MNEQGLYAQEQFDTMVHRGAAVVRPMYANNVIDAVRNLGEYFSVDLNRYSEAGHVLIATAILQQSQETQLRTHHDPTIQDWDVRDRCEAVGDADLRKESSDMYRRPFILESDDNDEESVVEGEDEIIIRKAFKLIADLTCKDKSGYFVQQFTMNGTFATIAKRMKQFRQNEALQEEAFMILLYISFANFNFLVDDNNAIAQPVMLKVFNDTVLTILLDTMNGYSKNQKLQHGALTMLHMIASKCIYIQVILIEQFQVVE